MCESTYLQNIWKLQVCCLLLFFEYSIVFHLATLMHRLYDCLFYPLWAHQHHGRICLSQIDDLARLRCTSAHHAPLQSMLNPWDLSNSLQICPPALDVVKYSSAKMEMTLGQEVRQKILSKLSKICKIRSTGHKLSDKTNETKEFQETIFLFCPRSPD